jgi:hypothetical protein
MFFLAGQVRSAQQQVAAISITVNKSGFRHEGKQVSLSQPAVARTRCRATQLLINGKRLVRHR